MFFSIFELLPDEILLEICVYLKPFDVINSFGQLNDRLERTISQYRRDADLHHLTLRQFQRWHQDLFAWNAESIVHLVLSNWNSPGQIYLFNQLTTNYDSLSQIMPNLVQLRLIDFTNLDVEILSKMQTIERIYIDVDGLIPLAYSTHVALDHHLFCSSNHFKEIRLWGVESGIELQHQVEIIENNLLEKLTISIASFDDLMLLFRRSPNLLNFNTEVTKRTSKKLPRASPNETFPQHLSFFHFQTTDQSLISSEDLQRLIANLPTIELLSLDMDTDDLSFADGSRWTDILGNLLHLKHVYFKLRIGIGILPPTLDLNLIAESFRMASLPICCYNNKKILYIDTVPYDMSKFDTNMSVTTSPSARFAQTTNLELYHQRSRRVQTLIMDGQHDQTSVNDWLSVIDRFSGIEILQINAVNIEADKNTELHQRIFHLPHLAYLHYIRSTLCKVHIPFFMFLASDVSVTPRLKALSMMYGDLVYLCKRLSGHRLERIEELWLYGGEADGHVVLKDIDLLLRTFPCLRHFFFNNQSNRHISRQIEVIIEMILGSSPKLISFRMSCNKGSLQLPSWMKNDETCSTWIKRICGLRNHEPIHVIVNKKIISIWK